MNTDSTNAEPHSVKKFKMLSEGTIIALATPAGSGAIGTIRLSGPDAFEKTSFFFALNLNNLGIKYHLIRLFLEILV